MKIKKLVEKMGLNIEEQRKTYTYKSKEYKKLGFFQS